MMNAHSDPDDILAEITFNAGLLDYEGAREAAKTILKRVVELAAKRTKRETGQIPKDLIADLTFNVVADCMPRQQAASETSSAAAATEME